MICFQLLVSLVFWTTQKRWSPCNRSLWFAFNYWYLWYSEQLIQISNQITLVVICFQLLVSLVFWTTWWGKCWGMGMLWFAFNYWYLWYSEQLDSSRGTSPVSCDLLSIIGIFGILNNFNLSNIDEIKVVICFQLLVSLVFWTTSIALRWSPISLWFAFNYWYLWYSEQRLIERWQ